MNNTVKTLIFSVTHSETILLFDFYKVKHKRLEIYIIMHALM